MVSGEMISLKGGFPTHWQQVKLFRWIYTLHPKCTDSMGFSGAHEGAIVIRSAGYVGSNAACFTMWWLRSSRCVAKPRVDCD